MKSKLVKIFFGVLSLMITTIFIVDVNRSRNNIHTIYFDEDDPGEEFAYPVSEYEIEINEPIGLVGFSCDIWIKSLGFKKQGRFLDSDDDCYVTDIVLRSYQINPDKRNKIDWSTVIYENERNKQECYSIGAIVEKMPPQNVRWSFSESSPELFPFDTYEFDLKFEEETEYTGVLTNKQPEQITIKLNHPNFNITSVSPDKIILRRKYFLQFVTLFFLALVVVFTYYLFRQKTLADFYPKIIGLFVGIWGVRSILVTDAPVFPTVVDYFTLGAMILIAGIIIDKQMKNKTKHKV